MATSFVQSENVLIRGENALINSRLIYDVGGNMGEDTDFYLRKGFNVVTIEGNPDLARKLRERFRSNIANGSLVVIDAAIAERSGEVEFYVNQSHSIWGTIRPTWAERNAKQGSPSRSIKVRAVTFPAVLSEHGVPYYLKIDIEGADLLCLEGLLENPNRPRFVSIESEKRSWRALLYEFEILQKLGYSKFKIVDQGRIGRQKPPNPIAEGRVLRHTFEPGSSGLFGEELPGRWLTARQAIRRYRFIFLKYRLFGDFGILRGLVKVRGIRRIVWPSWYDTHASV